MSMNFLKLSNLVLSHVAGLTMLQQNSGKQQRYVVMVQGDDPNSVWQNDGTARYFAENYNQLCVEKDGVPALAKCLTYNFQKPANDEMRTKWMFQANISHSKSTMRNSILKALGGSRRAWGHKIPENANITVMAAVHGNGNRSEWTGWFSDGGHGTPIAGTEFVNALAKEKFKKTAFFLRSCFSGGILPLFEEENFGTEVFVLASVDGAFETQGSKSFNVLSGAAGIFDLRNIDWTERNERRATRYVERAPFHNLVGDVAYGPNASDNKNVFKYRAPMYYLTDGNRVSILHNKFEDSYNNENKAFLTAARKARSLFKKLREGKLLNSESEKLTDGEEKLLKKAMRYLKKQNYPEAHLTAYPMTPEPVRPTDPRTGLKLPFITGYKTEAKDPSGKIISGLEEFLVAQKKAKLSLAGLEKQHKKLKKLQQKSKLELEDQKQQTVSLKKSKIELEKRLAQLGWEKKNQLAQLQKQAQRIQKGMQQVQWFKQELTNANQWKNQASQKIHQASQKIQSLQKQTWQAQTNQKRIMQQLKKATQCMKDAQQVISWASKQTNLTQKNRNEIQKLTQRIGNAVGQTQKMTGNW